MGGWFLRLFIFNLHIYIKKSFQQCKNSHSCDAGHEGCVFERGYGVSTASWPGPAGVSSTATLLYWPAQHRFWNSSEIVDNDFYHEMQRGKSVDTEWAVGEADNRRAARQSRANIHVCDGSGGLPGGKAGPCAGCPGYVHQRYPPFFKPEGQRAVVIWGFSSEGVALLSLFISYQKCYTQQYYLLITIFKVSPPNGRKIQNGHNLV